MGSQDREIDQLVREGLERMQTSALAHREAWGYGSHEDWSLDQGTGLLSFGFPDRSVSVPAQVLGSYSRKGRSFVWAWANPSIGEALSRTAGSLRDYGERHGIGALAVGRLDDLDERQAADLVSLAAGVCRADGFFHDAGATTVPYLTFEATVTLAPSDGDPTSMVVQTR